MKKIKYLVLVLLISILNITNSYSQCQYTIRMTDDYGDGWQGGKVIIFVAGTAVDTFALANGAGPVDEYFSVSTGDEIRATYNAGNWPQENEYHIFDAVGNEVFAEGVGGVSPVANDTLVSISSCPACPTPVSLNATNISITSADLSWIESGSATTWNIEYGLAGFTQGSGTTIYHTTNNPYNLTGLNATTNYDFYVQAVCSSSDSSTWAGPYTFITECNAVSAPYTEHFESGSLPGCWNTYSSSGELWKFTATTSNDHAAPNDHTSGSGLFAWIDDSESPSSTDLTLESPYIDVSSLTSPEISFWLYSDNEGGANATLILSIFDGTSWHNNVANYTGNTAGWENKTFDLSIYTITAPIKIKFIVDENNSDYHDDISIDDFEVRDPLSCPSPTNLSVNNITSNSAQLYWFENGSATTWNIEYGLAGFTQGTGTTIYHTTTHPYNLTGLNSSTNYDFYVESICSPTDSSTWTGPYTFTTNCSAYTAPFIETFDASQNTPNCWSNYSTTGENWRFGFSGGTNHYAPTDHTTGNGNFAWIDDSENPASSDLTLETPMIDASSLANPELSFWLWSNDEGAGINATLYVNFFDGSTWHNNIATYSGNTAGWENKIIDLSTYTLLGPIQIQFVVDENNGNYTDDISLDDVEIREPVTCPSPSLFNVSYITSNSANISWTENGSASQWNIEYGLAGFTQGTGTTIYHTTSNPYSLTGLNSSTYYDFYVQAVCSSTDSSTWTGPYTFQTLITPINNPSNCEIGFQIPDADCVDLPIHVINQGTQLGGDVVLKQVNLIISHTYDLDLSFSLTSPNGVSVDLATNYGGGGDNYGLIDGTCTNYTTFDMNGIDGAIGSGTAPFVGSFIPDGNFDDFNDSSDPNGNWILHLCDMYQADSGKVEYIELVFEQILPPANIIINEVDCDQAGTDTSEFIELYDGGYGNYPLDDYVVVFYNGSNDQVYAAYDLDGYTTDSLGYFVLGNSSVQQAQINFANNFLQNGADAVALYQDDSTSFPPGTYMTTTNIKDALVYGTNDPIDVQLLTLLNNGQPQINEDNLGNKNLHSCSRLPNGSGGQRNTATYNAAIPTPGAKNHAVPELNWSTQTFIESFLNNGSIATTINLSLNNNKFAQLGNLTENTHFTVSNVPAGLTTQITVLTDTTAQINLTGNALSHTDADDISNLNITFLDSAYNEISSIYVLNNSQNSINVDFFDTVPPTLLYDTLQFNEDSANTGSFTDSIYISLLNDKFTISTGTFTNNLHFTTNNVPNGLSVEITATTDSSAYIKLTGNATSHTNADDISNLNIIFNDTAFIGNNASNVYYSNQIFNVNFIDILNDSTDILTYSFPQQTAPAIINDTNHTVNIEVANGTDLSNLTATYTLSTGASATVLGTPQTSGISTLNFTSPVVYNILAEDGFTNQDWIIYVSIAVDINKHHKNNILKIYPNPTNNIVTIESSDLNINKINILDITGRTIYQEKEKSRKCIVNVNDYPKGIYLIKIEMNNQTIIKKLVISE